MAVVLVKKHEISTAVDKVPDEGSCGALPTHSYLTRHAPAPGAAAAVAFGG